MIRGSKKKCPFGLPIPYGCKSAGSCVRSMSHEVEEDGVMDNNFYILMLCEDELSGTCIFADSLIELDEKNALVDCKFSKDFDHIPAGNVGINGSSLYPNFAVGDMFQPIKGMPLDYIMDDNESKNYFGSIYTDMVRHLI